MNVLPCPWTLASLISPPSSTASSRLMARPRPVPPYLREVPASACWKASKISRCFSGAMPMPVSSTAKATTCWRLAEHRVVGTPALRGEPDAHLDVAVSGELDGVGQQVLEDLLQALGVAVHRARQVVGELHVERQVLGLGDVPEVAVDVVAQAGEGDLLDLDGDGAGLDLREVENVVDEVQQVGAGRIDVARELDLLAERLPGAFSASCWLRIRIELSGVRSSCDMLARNSDLYFEVSASSAAFSSSAWRACSTSAFLRSTSAFCSASSLRLGAQLLVGLLQFALAATAARR